MSSSISFIYKKQTDIFHHKNLKMCIWQEAHHYCECGNVIKNKISFKIKKCSNFWENHDKKEQCKTFKHRMYYKIDKEKCIVCSYTYNRKKPKITMKKLLKSISTKPSIDTRIDMERRKNAWQLYCKQMYILNQEKELHQKRWKKQNRRRNQVKKLLKYRQKEVVNLQKMKHVKFSFHQTIQNKKAKLKEEINKEMKKKSREDEQRLRHEHWCIEEEKRIKRSVKPHKF